MEWTIANASFYVSICQLIKLLVVASFGFRLKLSSMEGTSVELSYDDFRNKNIVEKTKGNYIGRIKLFLNWLRDHYPVCFKEDTDEGEATELVSFDEDFLPSNLDSKMLENG